METLQYIMRKSLYSIPLIFGVSLISFIMMVYFGPDPAYTQLGKGATQEDLEKIREQMGYNDPIYTQYFKFLQQIVTFDFGRSKDNFNEEVTSVFSKAIKISFAVALPGFILGNLISIILGLWAAYYRSHFFDKLIMGGSVVGMSISFVVVVVVFKYIFCSSYGLNLFPTQGWGVSYYDIDLNRNVVDWTAYFKYVTVPTMCSIFVSVGYNTRFYRAVFVEELTRDHVRTAKAFGCSTYKLLFKHVLKNSLIPIITRIILSLPFVIIGGSLIVESYFGIPGIGNIVYKAIGSGDHNITKAAVVCTAILYVIFLTLTDILYQVVDPRISLK